MKTALVAEDSPAIRQMVALTLREAGFTVVEAGDGREACELLELTGVDLIVTDLDMPKIDGVALIRQARSRPATRFTPILMLITESQTDWKLEGRAAGATGWISKPFQSTRLIEIVRRVLP
jgi:two-component system chemotaxis response regulator CheY